MGIKNMTFFGITPMNCESRRNRRSLSLTVSEYEIFIPISTYRAFGEPKFVKVGYNDQNKIFGVKPLCEPSKYSIEVCGIRRTKSDKLSPAIARQAIIEKMTKLRKWDRQKNNLILVDGEFDEESGYWIFDIDTGIIAPRKIRKGE